MNSKVRGDRKCQNFRKWRKIREDSECGMGGFYVLRAPEVAERVSERKRGGESNSLTANGVIPEVAERLTRFKNAGVCS